MRLAPCDDWTTAEAVEADPRICVPDEVEFPAAAYVQRATEAMWPLTGRRFGTCTATVRPVRRGCGCACDFGCGDDGGILLHSPFVSVDSVTIDGEPFVDYHIRNGRTIHRSDNKAWPSTQDLGKPTTETNTFAITYTYGVEPPEFVKKATLELAVQLALLDQQSAQCQLPSGAGTVTYQGITIDMERALATSNAVISSALNAYPMGAGAPPDAWFASDWDLVIVSA